MSTPQKEYMRKRGAVLVKNLQSRHFDACYCDSGEDALEKALSWIPEGSLVGWGGAMSAEQIGLLEALRHGARGVSVLDRDTASYPEERTRIMKRCLGADVFITGANALSMDGQMVNIDGGGNRVAAIAYGPDSIIVIAGMNKVEDTLELAFHRARTVAAPMNSQRFPGSMPCYVTGKCADCKQLDGICSHIVITRNTRVAGRIKFILVGESLGL